MERKQCKRYLELEGKNEELEVTIERQKTLITEKSNQIEMLKKSWKHLYNTTYPKISKYTES